MGAFNNNCDLVRAFINCRSSGHAEDAGPLCAPEFVAHYPPSAAAPTRFGQSDLASKIDAVLTAFPDWQEEILELWEAGDRVSCRTVARGTHLGPLEDIAPTGNRIEILSTSVFRVEGGRIQEQWYMYDALALLQQLGTDDRYLEKRLFPARGAAGN